METRRLYEEDPYATHFQADIISSKPEGDHFRVILDRTLFYPEGGGQPSDTGNLGGVPVLLAREEDGQIIHVMTSLPASNKAVPGEIYWERRFDHMQQHSGQHILSAASDRLLRARTIGFHLGSSVSTIDLARPEIDDNEILQIEDLANRTVFANLPVRIDVVPSSDSGHFDLRKPPPERESLRIVSIGEFDRIACCGTHVRKSGEIGLIKIIANESYKGGRRITFLCGGRALSDYRSRFLTLDTACRSLTVGQDELLHRLAKLQEELAEQKINQRRISRELDRYQAAELLREGEDVRDIRLVTTEIQDRTPKEISGLVKEITAAGSVLVILGVRQEQALLLLGKSQRIAFDLPGLVQELKNSLGWRGGGNELSAQLSGPDPHGLEEALREARAAVLRMTAQA